MIATDKQKRVRTELENAIAQPKESLATNAINVIEQTNIMEIQSKTHVFVSFTYLTKERFIFFNIYGYTGVTMQPQFQFTDSLSIDYQFTFNLSKVDDKHLTAISFKNQPTKNDVDVDFSIKCVNKGGQQTQAKVFHWFTI